MNPDQNNNRGQNPNNKQGFSTNRPGGFNNRQGGFNNRPGGFNRPNGPRQPRPQVVSEFYEKVVQMNMVSKKGKGGDKKSRSVLVVVGDRKGRVGVGLGKAGATDIQSAIRKATAAAKKNLIQVELKDGRTIAHDVYFKLGAAKVLLKPAPEGTGVIAGGPVRVVVEACGIKDIVSKILGTNNKASNVHVTLAALKSLKGETNAVK
jgi:small subunit ribosomal protein S5